MAIEALKTRNNIDGGGTGGKGSTKTGSVLNMY